MIGYMWRVREEPIHTKAFILRLITDIAMGDPEVKEKRSELLRNMSTYFFDSVISEEQS